MNKKSLSIKFLLVAFLPLMALSACSKKAPEDILMKTQQALIDLESGKVAMDIAMMWRDAQSDLGAQMKVNGVFGAGSLGKRMLDVAVLFSGHLNTAEKKTDLSGAFDVINNEIDYYVKLNAFETNDENLQFFEPLLNIYKGKWLQLSEDFIPESIAGLQNQAADELLHQQLDELFVQAKLFDVKEDHGIQEINGREAYYLSLEPNMSGFKDYFRQVGVLRGMQMSEAELEELALRVNQLRDIEVYVDTEKYYIYKAHLNLYSSSSDSSSSESESDLKIALSFEGSHFNEPADIKIPDSAEAFNPLAIPASLNSATPFDEAAAQEEGGSYEAPQASGDE